MWGAGDGHRQQGAFAGARFFAHQSGELTAPPATVMSVGWKPLSLRSPRAAASEARRRGEAGAGAGRGSEGRGFRGGTGGLFTHCMVSMISLVPKATDSIRARKMWPRPAEQGGHGGGEGARAPSQLRRGPRGFRARSALPP